MASKIGFIEDVIAGVKAVPGGECLKVKHSEAHPESFGNAVVQFIGPGYDVRFIRDKGDVFFQVASQQDDCWWGDDLICEVLGVGPAELGLPTSLKKFSEIASELEERFKGQEYASLKKKLEMRVQQRRDEMLRSLPLTK